MMAVLVFSVAASNCPVGTKLVFNMNLNYRLREVKGAVQPEVFFSSIDDIKLRLKVHDPNGAILSLP